MMGYWIELHCDKPDPSSQKCFSDRNDNPSVLVPSRVSDIREGRRIIEKEAKKAGWTKLGRSEWLCPGCLHGTSVSRQNPNENSGTAGKASEHD